MSARHSFLRSIAAAGLLALAATADAQAPTDSLERRFRFAELFTGADLTVLPAGRIGNEAGALPGRALPRVTIGGLHFWGHADCAVTFPLGAAERDAGALSSRLGTGVETRGRWYLRPLRTDGVAPFVGGGLGAVDLQLGDGPRTYRMQPMGQAGFAWRRGGTLVEAGWSARPALDLPYPVSRTTTTAVRPPSQSVFVGVHRLFETTASLAEPIRRGDHGRRERALREAGRLSGPTLAAGVSSPILIGSGAFNRVARPFLAERPRGRAMPDLGLGWHFEEPQLQLNLAWRQMQFTTSAFAFTQRNERRSLALEAYRFLGDWHGFVPFVGPALSMERLRVRETDGGVGVTDVAREVVAPGVTFGWDIRPTRSQAWVLRTNLRWFPSLRVPLPGGTQALDQLEFNFIQLVWYPRR